MCQWSRGRRDINEHVKSSEPDKQYDAWLLFFVFIYVSFLHILFWRKHNYNNRRTKSKTNIKKKRGGQVAVNNVWLCPSNKTKFSFFFLCFFFQIVLKLHPYLLVSFTIKRREHTCSFSYLFTFFFFPSLLLAKNKSLSSSSLKCIYKFKQICFPPKLAANEQLQKCFFGYSWYGRLFGLRILFVIKFLTNLFSFISVVFLFFFLYSLISY